MKPHETFQNAGSLVTEAGREREAAGKRTGGRRQDLWRDIKNEIIKDKIVSNGLWDVPLAVTCMHKRRKAWHSVSHHREETPPKSQIHPHIWMECTQRDSRLRPASRAE